MKVLSKFLVMALSILLASVLIYQYNPAGLYTIISDNIDYWQFAIIAALSGPTIYALNKRK